MINFMKTFLLWDSAGLNNEFIMRLLAALADDGLTPFLLARPASPLRERFKEKSWRGGVYRFWPDNLLWLLALSPLWWLGAAMRLLFYQQTFKIKTVICLGTPAKFLATWPASWLGWQVIWLETPNFDYSGLGRFGLKCYRLMAVKVKLVCFSLTTKLALLNLDLAEDRLTLIWPGIEPAEFQNQVSLFQNLASKNYQLNRKKYFTVGTVVDFKEPQRTETLMRAVKEALLIIPNLRLIVIGDGAARQQAEWLSKRLALSAAVWLVGSQTDLKKWYANFAVFVVASSTPGLDDWLMVLAAMINGVPVIAPRDLSLEDCFLGGQAGILLSLTNAEELSATMIKLEQDQDLRKNLSHNAKRVARDFFALSRAKDEFKQVINL